MPHSWQAAAGLGQDMPVYDIKHPLGCHTAILEVGYVWPGLPQTGPPHDGGQKDCDDLPTCVVPSCHAGAAVPQGLSTLAARQGTSDFPAAVGVVNAVPQPSWLTRQQGKCACGAGRPAWAARGGLTRAVARGKRPFKEATVRAPAKVPRMPAFAGTTSACTTEFL